MKARKIVIGIVIALVVVYLAVTLYFMTHFLPNVTVNGVDVSMKTASESEDLFYEKSENYVLTILERNNCTETIAGEDVNLRYVFDGEFDDIIRDQNAYIWPAYFVMATSVELDGMARYDEEMLESVVENLSCMDESSWIESEDAELGDYDATSGVYLLTEPVYGTCINAKTFEETIDTKLSCVEEELDLAEEGCYVDPVITEDTEEAAKLVEEASTYGSSVITFEFDDETEVLDASTIKDWLIVAEDYSVTLDETKAAEYVETLAEKYDTLDLDKTVTAASGESVTVKAKTYGWEMDKEKTAKLILKKIYAGDSYTGDVKWLREAASHGENDYGDTYVDINLTTQHLRLFVGGEVILETDFVSGNVSNGCKTPGGAYYVTYKEANAVLRGDDYETPVSYWMPFNGGIGLHDATWRSTFGGSIYKTNGSHGCINLPLSAAKTIFENVEAGTPVLCYYMPGTEPANGTPKKDTTSDEEKTSSASNKKKTEEKVETADDSDDAEDSADSTDESDNSEESEETSENTEENTTSEEELTDNTQEIETE
ncbi:MAG: L,D-transpeptidase/peptidoglycan binding protein [Eubacterium sp.]|nr:L,D-transpeptidase/peptidoglycan binding protein [Eubacterium sp.]